MPVSPLGRRFRLLIFALVAVLVVGGAIGWYITSEARNARAAFAEYATLRSAADSERQLADNCVHEAARVKSLAAHKPKQLDLPPVEANRRAEVLTAEGAAHTRRAEELLAQAATLQQRWGQVWQRLGYDVPAQSE